MVLKALKQRFRNMGLVSQLLMAADKHTIAMGDQLCGAEHLVLAAFDLPDATAREAFLHVGANPDGFKGAIRAQYETALHAIGIQPPEIEDTPEDIKQPLFKSGQPSARDVMRAMAGMSNFKDARPVLGAEVIVAVCMMDGGTAVRALREMKIDKETLKQAAQEIIDTYPE